MMRRKNLERAVVLGLLLSTSVYGSAWAENTNGITQSNFVKNENGEYEYSLEENINVQDKNAISINGKNNYILNVKGDSIIVKAESSNKQYTSLELRSGNLKINTIGELTFESVNNAQNQSYGIYLNNIYLKENEKNALKIETANNLNVTAKSIGNRSFGVYVYFTANSGLNTQNEINFNSEKNINITAESEQSLAKAVYVYTTDNQKKPRGRKINNSIIAENDINIAANANEARVGSNTFEGKGIHVVADYNLTEATTTLKANNINITASGSNQTTSGIDINSSNGGKNKIKLEARKNIDIYATGSGLNIEDKNLNKENTKAELIANGLVNIVGERVSGQANIDDLDNTSYGIKNIGAYVDVKNDGFATQIVAMGPNSTALYTKDSNLNIETFDGINIIRSTSGSAIETDNSENSISSNNNYITAGNVSTGFGTSYAINAIGQSTVNLNAQNGTNTMLGAVYVSGHSDTDTSKTDVTLTGGANMVLSNAYIDKADSLTDKKVISALYAEKGAHIKLDGDTNLLGTYAVSSSEDLERVVWAYDTADIDITGLTAISTDSYDLATNSKDIAVVAGTATGLDKLSADEILGYDGDRANVDINYESDSSITGDILSAYAGTVNIAANTENTRAASDSKVDIRGNLLAGNNGILDVDLGNGGTLTGRADDYGDAGLNTGHGAVEGEDSFFNPAFSSEIKANGTVNLTMGEGSVWNVTGQSWITKLNTTENVADTLINLENAKDEELNINASALTIGTLNGSTQFYMNLDGDRSASDMLYIKNADGQYNIYLQEEVTSSEINADGFNGLRFATVGEGSNADFTVRSQGTGSAFDVVYTVGTDSYEGNSENTAYNSTTGEGGANTQKPGNASVDDFFGLTNNAVEDDSEIATNSIMLMAENEEAADNAANANSGLNEVTNFKIIARADEELNDTGETIINMSRANYSNAIYMDRLNKRLGEARYINDDPEEDEGMWVRIRHDRIGKEDAFRSQNTMYQLGYDKRQECDNGERRVGFAVDYMHGDTGYTDIAGKGEIDRYGLWLYDTWMGDKGHYADYIAKWGHLDNDFEIYAPTTGQRIDGDYSNNVFSVSAEYGRKKDIGNDWYFEPQAQLQLARVTGADYTTNQGTKVSVDGINSLIGRAGFRIGKDFGEEKQSTLYFKADVLHEFLGDQDVYVMDKSTDNKWAGISYENEGTWYDIGIGYAAMMSKSSYAFIDLEQSFGNDNDDTYQINAGVRWTF